YGYSGRRHFIDARRLPNDDGIWLVNTDTGQSHLLLSLAQLAQLSPRPCMSGAEHYLNHLEFSPSGEHLCFLHRWHVRGNSYSRLYTIRLDGTGLRCLADDDLVSHHSWFDNHHLLVWARRPGTGEHFYCFDIRAGVDALAIVGEGNLVQDGHPS